MSWWFRQKLKWTSSFTLAAQKPQTYTYSCPQDRGCCRPLWAVSWEEGVARLTEVIFTAAGKASFLLSRKGWFPYSTVILSINKPLTAIWKWRTLNPWSRFPSPEIIFIWHNDLRNYSKAEETPFMIHNVHIDLLFVLVFFVCTLSCFKVTRLVQKNLKVEVERKVHSDHPATLTSIKNISM